MMAKERAKSMALLKIAETKLKKAEIERDSIRKELTEKL